MRRVVRGIASAAIVVLIVAFSACGHDQRLVQITVTPDTFTLKNAVGGETIQFAATGQFVYPPGNRDITQQVAWSTPSDVVTIDQNGLATVTGTACGTNIPVTATGSTNLHLPPSGDIVTGTATLNVQLVGCTGP